MHSYLTLELCHLVKLSYVALLDSGCVLSTELFTLLRIIMWKLFSIGSGVNY